MEIPSNFIPRVAVWKTKDPYPKHDFSLLENSELSKTMGLVAASQKQLEEQLKSRMRLEPNALEIRYFYYEVKDGRSES